MIGLSIGRGSRGIDILTPSLAYERVLSSRVLASAKLTYSSASGELGDHAALGDLFLNAHYVARQDNGRFFFTAGAKIPLGNADGEGDGISLPMDYQSSLATLDLIAGAGYAKGPFGVHIGWQQPLTAEISNTFLAEQYPDSRGLNYNSTNRFSRKADALLRLSYDLKMAEGRFTVRPSILPIYHVANDAYIDSLGVEREIAGSRGITLNGNVFVIYRITRAHELELSYGMPFETREARPDGLTRKYVLTFEYHLLF
jgi:hypothetical protein